MPFGNPVPRTFTAMSIRAHAPVEGGVYGLSNASEWLYIGTAANIRHTLYTHLQERDNSLTSRGPVGFVYEACPSSLRDMRCERLISEYAPVRNRDTAG